MPAWTGIEVEVDEETGQYEVLNFVCGTDAGRVINAAGGRGQVEGGVWQGLGEAMFERLIYGPDGLITPSPLTYRLPLAADLPKHFEGFLEEHGMGPGPFGSKGIGESSILGVAAAPAHRVGDHVGAGADEPP